MILHNSQLEDHADGAGDLNAIIHGNWISINDWHSPTLGLTASQSGTTVTASAAVFDADDAGATIRFADGTVRTISSITNATTAVVSVSGTVTSQSFLLYRTDTSKGEVVAAGLVKRVRMLSSYDGLYPRWNHATKRFEMAQPVRTVVKSADESTATHGGGSDSDLTVPVLAGNSYLLEFSLAWLIGATDPDGNPAFNFSVPAKTGDGQLFVTWWTSGGGVEVSYTNGAFFPSGLPGVVFAAATNVETRGWLRMTPAADGNIVLQWDAAGATDDVTLRAGSWFKLTQE